MRRSRMRVGQFAPYLVSLVSILAVAAVSSTELIQPGDLVIPVAVTFAVAATAHGLAYLATGSWEKGALIAVLVAFTFAIWGPVMQTLLEFGSSELPGGEAILVLLFGVALGGFVLAVAGTSQPLGGLLVYIALLSGIVCAWNTIVLGRAFVASGRRLAPLTPSGIVAPPLQGRPPDVYLIILDQYSGVRPLLEQYGFDNHAILDFLRGRGLLVPRAPRSNYVQTFLSLPSLLNLTYLDSLIGAAGGPEARDRRPAHAATEGNRLVAFFRERGYRFVFFPSSYASTRQNRYADLQVPDPRRIQPELVTVWLRSTPLPTLRRLWCQSVGCPLPYPYTPETAKMLDWKFAQLATLHGGTQPLFVLAHFTLPHQPYLYGPGCEHQEPYAPDRDDGPEEARVKAAYVDQIQCVNRRLEALIPALQDHAPVPPVIILQSDHGHGRLGLGIPPLERATEAQVEDRTRIFAAYLVPGAPPSELPDTVTPLNAMRFVLRHAFGASLPALPDASFWSDKHRPFRLTRVR